MLTLVDWIPLRFKMNVFIFCLILILRVTKRAHRSQNPIKPIFNFVFFPVTCRWYRLKAVSKLISATSCGKSEI